jgi:hypothetical protein
MAISVDPFQRSITPDMSVVGAQHPESIQLFQQLVQADASTPLPQVSPGLINDVVASQELIDGMKSLQIPALLPIAVPELLRGSSDSNLANLQRMLSLATGATT